MRLNDGISEHMARPFASCTPRQLNRLSRLATVLDVPAGRELTTEGQPGHEFVVVLDGVATVEVGAQRVSILTEGDWFGEIALLDAGPRTATVTARTPMTIAVFGRREFATLLDEVPGFARTVMAGLARRLRATDAGAAEADAAA